MYKNKRFVPLMLDPHWFQNCSYFKVSVGILRLVITTHLGTLQCVLVSQTQNHTDSN